MEILKNQNFLLRLWLYNGRNRILFVPPGSLQGKCKYHETNIGYLVENTPNLIKNAPLPQLYTERTFV